MENHQNHPYNCGNRRNYCHNYAEQLVKNWVKAKEDITLDSPCLITGIDQSLAELIDDQRFSLVESEYWDETHDWGDEAFVRPVSA